MKKRFRVFLSFMLSVIFVFTGSITAFAEASLSEAYREATPIESITHQLSYGDNRTYTLTYVNHDCFIISATDENGTLIEESIFSPDYAIQLLANGKKDLHVYRISEYIKLDTSRTFENSIGEDNTILSDVFVPRSVTSGVWYEPPLLNDSGLVNSTIFPGYKYLGSTGPDSTYEISIGVHRKIAISHGKAYHFSVTPGTTVSTLAGLLLSAFTPESLLLAIAISLASTFLSVFIDCYANGKVDYEQIHYTYKYICNNSSVCISKDCECRQWWVIYDVEGNEVGREDKDMAAYNHLPLNILERCSLVRGDYVNGVYSFTNCTMAAA